MMAFSSKSTTVMLLALLALAAVTTARDLPVSAEGDRACMVLALICARYTSTFLASTHL